MEADDLDESEQIGKLKQKIQAVTDVLARLQNDLRVLESKKSPQVNETNGSSRSFAELERRVQRLNAEVEENYVIREEDLLEEQPSDDRFVVSMFDRHTTERFSRQMMLDQIGVEGQEKLLNASVLIIGCGGIGSPCIQYLAACGVGTLGLVDYDTVELSNLHRQVIHTTASIGKSKVVSAKAYVESLNRNVKVNAHEFLLDSTNAHDIVRRYDVVCDACDNAPTRYLVNDACLMTGRPLISASALGLEGQLCVYCYKDAPCYRCVYPVPPPPETVGSCGENGVLGPVPGFMGTLQAVEAIKLIVGLDVLEKLFLYDADTSRFLTVRMRAKNPECICARPAEVKLVDYELFCSSKANDKTPDISILQPKDHISVRDYRDIFLAFGVKHELVDVRSQREFDMVHLQNAHPFDLRELEEAVNSESDDTKASRRYFWNTVMLNKILEHRHIFFICRRGNDSQKAVLLLRKYIEKIRNIHQLSLDDHLGNDDDDVRVPIGSYVIKNIQEGYYGWHKYIDNSIPLY